MKKDNVYIETIPNHYVGPFMSITIHVREKDAEKMNIGTLKKRLVLDVASLNAMDETKML